jgi:hypothetical protein
MAVTEAAPKSTDRSRRRAGYVVAIIFNIAVLVVVNNILAWGWLPWLTDDFTRVVPIINVSLAATLLANVIWIGYDSGWFKSLGQIVLNLISIAAALRMWSVFPFDFSAYDFGWAGLVRILLILGIVGTAIAIAVEIGTIVRLSAASRDA